MPVLASNQIIVPFFSRPMTFVRGLDPLGLQNTSESTFAMLLPGLNNVTGRIRYYSFYCWLLNEYAKQSGSTDPSDQRKFIRRAELIVALVNRSTSEEISAIPGSNYANKLLNDEDISTYDLQTATYNPDGTTEGTYWKYGSGAFGQYYVGSLLDIGLITERENGSGIFVRTPKKEGVSISGEDLAIAFEKNISKKNSELFFSCIKKGKIKDTDLESLFEELNLSFVPPTSDERKNLTTLLLEKDFPQILEEAPLTFRRKSIKHLLQYSADNNEITDRQFTIQAYDLKGKFEDAEDDCLTGWYYYQLNEYWQYSCLGVFNGTMDYLEKEAGSGWKNLYQLVEEISEQVINHLQRDELLKSSKQKIKDVFFDADDWMDEAEIFKLINESRTTERIANSIFLILCLVHRNKEYTEILKTYGGNNFIEKDGDGTTFCMKFEKYFDYTAKDFLKEFLLTHIIYRHQFVAFRKMGNGIQSTQLFLIEDARIRRLLNFEPSLTGPRIRRLLGFLHDLGILQNQKLTAEGKSILKELKSESIRQA